MKKVLSLAMALLMTLSVFSTLAIPASAGSSIATATSISFNKTYSGEITKSNTKSVYKFTLPESGRVNISLKAYIYSTLYFLYDTEGNQIWQSGGKTWNSTSEVYTNSWNFDLTKGTYYFAIGQWYSDSIGSYNFKLTFKSANETFPEPQGGNNQTIKDADEIFFDEKINGQIAYNDSKDIYVFTLPESGRANINLKAYIYITSYYLYDAEGNQIWSSTGQYWNSTSEVYTNSWNFDLTKGTYYFAIQQYNGSGNYNFKLTFKSANVSFTEPQGGDNQILGQADKISLNKTYKSQIALNDTVDFYRFTLPASGKIRIKLTAYIYKTNYYLYDANGNVLWSKTGQYWNDASKKYTLDEEITLSKGKYYFAVSMYDGTGNYSFSINCTHKWSRVVDKKATMSADGSGTKTCSICGKKSTYTIPKIKSVKLSRTTYTYDGNVKKPTVTVKDSKGNELKNGTDYTVKYSSGRKNVGQYTVTVTFKGKYSGTKKLTFKINPKGTRITTLTAGTKQFTAKINKQATQTTGYQIQYSKNSSMKSATTKTYASTSTTTRTIKDLKAKTTYYVRVRTYKTVSGTKYYSSWSSVKSVKTK